MPNHNSKKIRIVSFQNAYNFGAILQAFGLQETIRSMGYEDVLFLNYNPKYLKDRYNPLSRRYINTNSIKSFIVWCVYYPFFFISSLKRNCRFHRSIQTLLKQTKNRISTEENLNEEEVDVLVCGSDQIWNSGITGDIDPIFLGKGNYKYMGYAVSYAPSTELSTLSEERARNIAGQLDSFRYLSVREKPVRDILSQYTDKEIKVCVDPTILCGVESFNTITSSRIVHEDYILVYAYDPKSSAIRQLIESVPEFKKYSIHTILLGPKSLQEFFVGNIHSEISVQDFLSYFKYSSYVITDSFHGLAFSLLFEKNFNVSYFEGKNARPQALLEQLGLESRLIRNTDDIQWDELDYSLINKRMAAIREESRSFLYNALKG